MTRIQEEKMNKVYIDTARKSYRTFICIFVLTLCVIAFSGCTKKEVVVPTLIEPVTVKLDTETVVRDTIYDIDLYDGSVVPYTEGVYFEEDSIIAEVSVGVGDSVEEGQTLLQLDRTKWQEEVTILEEEIAYIINNNAYTNEQFDYDIEIAKLQLSVLEKAENTTEIALKKIDIKALEEQRSYSEKLQNLELDQKLERLAKLKKQLERSDLVAPFSGTVVYIGNINEGSSIQAYDPIIYLADDQKLTVQTAYISGDIIQNSQDSYVMMDDAKYSITTVPYSEEEYNYKVYNKLTLKSNFAVEDEDVVLKSGMYAAVCFVRNYAEDVLAVPKKALYRDGSKRYVYKIVEGERIRQEVEVGRTTRIMAEITNGVSEGDEVYVQQ